MSPFAFSTGFLLICLASSPSAAAEKLTANTLTRGEAGVAPSAAMSDVAWLAGHWVGEGLGGASEEVWSPPRAGTMMGAYRLVRGDETAFYELMIIAEENGSLVLRLKHFGPDLSAWEEKDETVDFPLVALEADAAYFDGLTYRRTGKDEVTVFVAMHQEDGGVEEVAFVHRRGAP